MVEGGERGFSFEHDVDIKPCPFCGSGDVQFDTYLFESWVECCECEAHGPAVNEDGLETTEFAAIENWNKRAHNLKE